MFHATVSMPKRAAGTLVPLSLMAAVGLLGGCQLTDDSRAENAPKKNSFAIAAAITNSNFTDGSGRIKIRVKTCDPTGSATTNCSYCTADEGWARIGGGANILNESTPGAMLQASFPSPNSFATANAFGCTGAATPGYDMTWVARASGASHQLQAYVIQMQLVDAQGQSFKPSVSIGIDNVTGAVNPPAEYSVLSPSGGYASNQILVSGGAYLFTANDVTAPTSSYLVESRPVDTQDGRLWKASARSRISPAADEPLKSYAILADRCPSQWSGDCFTTPVLKQLTAAATNGYGTVTHTVSPSWVSSSPGGYAPTTTSGPRFLADLIPFNGSAKGFTVRSKGDGGGGTGTTYGSTLVFGLNTAYYAWNNLHFFNRGRLNRPSGTNPQLQQTPSTGTDVSSARWHLEPFGTGTYRLRHGNPDGGSECAYRDGSTSNVRVATCGSGNEFKWSTATFPYGFTLKNATDNRCLDANGTSGTTNVVLKTCGSAGGQSMHLGRVNWPN